MKHEIVHICLFSGYGGFNEALTSKDNLYVNGIRRLTPTECERLQGLPDQFTKFGVFENITKQLSDTQRYKLCGNGISLPPAIEIGKRLLEIFNSEI